VNSARLHKQFNGDLDISQTDLNAANASGANFRTDLNNHLAALASTSSGASEPSTRFANQLWVDTTNNLLKIRNEDNDAWITLFQLNQSTDVAECHTDTVDTNAIQNDAVDVNKIGAAAVDATALASNAVTSAKISAGAVLTAGIGDGQVTTAKLASGITTITGEIRMWATGTAPTGWQLCDGTQLNRTSESALFAVIGTTFGVGNGSTTFHVPNFQGRLPIGVGTSSATGATAWALAEAGGEETHTLTTAEMPAHSHAELFNTGSGSNNSGDYPFGRDDSGQNVRGDSTNDNSAVSNQNTGGGNAHNNMSPVMGINFIIKK